MDSQVSKLETTWHEPKAWELDWNCAAWEVLLLGTLGTCSAGVRKISTPSSYSVVAGLSPTRHGRAPGTPLWEQPGVYSVLSQIPLT